MVNLTIRVGLRRGVSLVLLQTGLQNRGSLGHQLCISMGSVVFCDFQQRGKESRDSDYPLELVIIFLNFYTVDLKFSLPSRSSLFRI